MALLVLSCVMSFRAEAAISNQPVRLGVVKFLSRTAEISEEQAAIIGDVFARMLTSSRTITVIERSELDAVASEHRLSTAGRLTDETALQVGKIAGCQYMLFGAVTNYHKESSSVDLWMFGTQKNFATATIDVRVVNVETTEVMLSLSETGAASQKGTKFNFYGMTNDKVDLTGIETGAITNAASRLSYRVREALTGEYAQVLKISGGEVTINIGSSGGAQVGGLFRIYVEGEEIRDVDGRLLGQEMKDIAVVKIVAVQQEFSTANLADKAAGSLKLARRGDKVFPLSSEELSALISRKAFMKTRPRETRRDSAAREYLNNLR